MDSIRASSGDCIFVILVEKEMDLLCDDSGQEVLFDTLGGASMDSISSVDASLNVSQIEENGNRFLLFSPCGRDKYAFFRICIGRPCIDDIPCAFFDQETKQYENFSIPADTGSVDISVGIDGLITVRWERNEEYGEEFADVLDVGVDDFEDPDGADEIGDGTGEMAGDEDASCEDYDVLEDRERELEEMRCRMARLEDENRRLRQKLLPVTGRSGDDALRSENDRLRKLVSQLADSGYGGDFEQTLDAQIDEQTQALVHRRKVCQDKKHSLERLLEEKDAVEQKVSDVTEEINQVIDLVQKGESALRESSSRLDETRRLLEEKLQELGIDEAALRLYQPDQSADQLLRESDRIRERVEDKLRELILARQEDANQRFDRVTS